MPTPHFAASTSRITSGLKGEERALHLTHDTERVPATFLVPGTARPAPIALLLHGFSSSKERMIETVGRALLDCGVGSLAVDLPLHGDREGSGGEIPYRNPLALVGAWRTAVREARAAVEWLTVQPEVDSRRIGVVGYSLGGFLALIMAAEESQVRAVALAAAGDLPLTTPYSGLVRRAVDPMKAARKLSGRPLLMVNGRGDRSTQPDQAERLFAHAVEPKQILWYDGGHWPPRAAIEYVAEWTATQLASVAGR